MKNFATRVLALVIALSVLLLPASAMAERNAFSLTAGNIELVSGEESIVIPVSIQIGGGADLENARGYGIVGVYSEDTPALSALASVENGEIRAYLNGMEYGITIPLEQLMSLAAPVLEQLEGQLTGVMTGFSPELQAAVTRTVEAYMALMVEAASNPEAYSNAQMDALGVTITEGTEAETVMLFDVEATAIPTTVVMEEKTVAQIFDAQMNATPAAAEFYAAYFDLLNEIMAMTGEEKIDFKAEMSKVEGSMSLNGTIYTADNGMLAEMVMPITIEGETVEFPITLTALTDEAGTYFDLLMTASNEGEEVYIEFYADDFNEEDTDYSNFSIYMGIGEEEAETYDMEMSFTLYTLANVEGTQYGVEVYVNDGFAPVLIDAGYFGYPVVSTAEADSYDGYLYLYLFDGYEEIEAYMDTNLTLSNIPAEELLTLASSINPLEADEEALTKLGTDAMNALMQGLGVLMQNETIASLIGG